MDKSKLTQLWQQNKSFMMFILLIFCVKGSIADWSEVPTGSMQPTIVEGDRLWVNKVAYDIKLPFSKIALYQFADPKRGDITIFDSKVADKMLVKRIIGVPGDTVAMQNNQLYINGKAARYQIVKQLPDAFLAEENIAGFKHYVRIEKTLYGELRNFPPVVVPEGMYLALGDNRDNSADSRVIGFVPRSEVIGRARHVVMSLDYDNYYLPRYSRFFRTL